MSDGVLAVSMASLRSVSWFCCKVLTFSSSSLMRLSRVARSAAGGSSARAGRLDDRAPREAARIARWWKFWAVRFIR